jgi:hypothetical protein
MTKTKTEFHTRNLRVLSLLTNLFITRTVTDIGVRSADEKNPEMFHRIGIKVGSKISEGEMECFPNSVLGGPR